MAKAKRNRGLGDATEIHRRRAAYEGSAAARYIKRLERTAKCDVGLLRMADQAYGAFIAHTGSRKNFAYETRRDTLGRRLRKAATEFESRCLCARKGK